MIFLRRLRKRKGRLQDQLRTSEDRIEELEDQVRIFQERAEAHAGDDTDQSSERKRDRSPGDKKPAKTVRQLSGSGKSTNLARNEILGNRGRRMQEI
jgi:hypothetical protein